MRQLSRHSGQFLPGRGGGGEAWQKSQKPPKHFRKPDVPQHTWTSSSLFYPYGWIGQQDCKMKWMEIKCDWGGREVTSPATYNIKPKPTGPMSTLPSPLLSRAAAAPIQSAVNTWMIGSSNLPVPRGRKKAVPSAVGKKHQLVAQHSTRLVIYRS